MGLEIGIDLGTSHFDHIDRVISPWEGLVDIRVFHRTRDDVGTNATACFKRKVATASGTEKLAGFPFDSIADPIPCRVVTTPRIFVC